MSGAVVELAAMRKILAALSKLDPAAQQRVVSWVADAVAGGLAEKADPAAEVEAVEQEPIVVPATDDPFTV